jgi:hypothetical protein
MRDRARDDLDRASLDAYLRFRSGQRAEGSCKVQDTQRRRAPCAVQIEAHWMKGDVWHPVRRQELCLSNLSCKSSALLRFAESRAGAGHRQGFPHFGQVRSASWIADRYINGESRHVNLGAVQTTHERKQVRRSVIAVGDKRTSLVVCKGELS